MARQLSESEVLKKLDIPDFRHLTKNKVIAMASMLDRMDPEVAKKAIEQFPDFSKTMNDILHDYKDSLDEGYKANDKSVISVYATCDDIISSLQDLLKDPDLTFEQKKYIIDKMAEIVKYKGDKDTENKRFILSLTAIFGAAVAFTAGALASVLGGNTKAGNQGRDNHDKKSNLR